MKSHSRIGLHLMKEYIQLEREVKSTQKKIKKLLKLRKRKEKKNNKSQTLKLKNNIPRTVKLMKDI